MDIQIKTENNGLKSWFGESVLLKVALIGIITLLLLIPSAWIQDLISERQSRQTEAIKDISDKWAGSQLVEGPVMILPYRLATAVKDRTGKESIKETVTNIYILPELLEISSSTQPEKLHRGSFEAVVYNTRITVKGKFSPLELKKSGINPEGVQWDKVKIDIGLSDLKGLKNSPIVQLDKKSYAIEPDLANIKLFTNNLIIQPDLTVNKATDLNFSFNLELRGSDELRFLHLGKNTTVRATGNWGSPSFVGRFLPEDRKLAANNFSALWKMPHFNRPFPQQWTDENTALSTGKDNASFGVQFILPVDQYQKTMRTAKYAVLIILLTFISLFFTEFINKKKVHLLQYVLIGAAMTIYYTLILSFSEIVGFNMAYLIASIATVLLISAFIGALLRNQKPALIFAGILTIFYSFIFIIIQLQDLALLFGSVGLFVIVAILMYLSATIDWSKKTVVPQT